jgi:bifunctional oligoribonuclease and PAP phosphatase NrnA
MEEKYQQLEKEVLKADKILIISHRKPDGDTLGGAISLKIWLDRLKKKTTLACVDRPSNVFGFLPYLDQYVDEFELSDYDLIFIIDSGASYMTNFHLKYPNLFETTVPIINIDHHATNDNFGTLNIVDDKAASATIILYRIFKYLELEINSEMATCLLTGIYNDTGSFMHSNTNKEVYEISADLMNNEAKIAEIGKNLFKNRSVSTLRLWGKVLEKTYLTADNVVMSVLRDDDFLTIDSNPEELSGVIDYLNMVPEGKFSVLINEDRKGNVKGSFRARDSEVDVARIAAVFGGGGHKKASGFSVPGKLKEQISYSIVSSDNSRKDLRFED